MVDIYGPWSAKHGGKTQFIQELGERRVLCPGPWLVLGDFNMILRASREKKM
jgi:hypothetical protein